MKLMKEKDIILLNSGRHSYCFHKKDVVLIREGLEWKSSDIYLKGVSNPITIFHSDLSEEKFKREHSRLIFSLIGGF